MRKGRAAFKKYQRVKKVKRDGEDYELTGWIAAVIRKRSGAVRYVLEAERPRGLLMIYSAKNLVSLEPGK